MYKSFGNHHGSITPAKVLALPPLQGFPGGEVRFDALPRRHRRSTRLWKRPHRSIFYPAGRRFAVRSATFPPE